MRRAAAKVDANQRQIVQVLRQCGATVFDASAVGDGFPDLVVLFRRQVLLLEVKNGARKLTPAEAAFHERWQGAPLYVVGSVDDAIGVLNAVE